MRDKQSYRTARRENVKDIARKTGTKLHKLWRVSDLNMANVDPDYKVRRPPLKIFGFPTWPISRYRGRRHDKR